MTIGLTIKTLIAGLDGPLEMVMSRHTAGPWFVREIDLHEGGKGVEVVATGEPE